MLSISCRWFKQLLLPPLARETFFPRIAHAEGRETSVELRVASACVCRDAPRPRDANGDIDAHNIMMFVRLAGNCKDKANVTICANKGTFRLRLRPQILHVVEERRKARHTQVLERERRSPRRHDWLEAEAWLEGERRRKELAGRRKLTSKQENAEARGGTSKTN